MSTSPAEVVQRLFVCSPCSGDLASHRPERLFTSIVRSLGGPINGFVTEAWCCLELSQPLAISSACVGASPLPEDWPGAETYNGREEDNRPLLAAARRLAASVIASLPICSQARSIGRLYWRVQHHASCPVFLNAVSCPLLAVGTPPFALRISARRSGGASRPRPRRFTTQRSRPQGTPFRHEVGVACCAAPWSMPQSAGISELFATPFSVHVATHQQLVQSGCTTNTGSL